MAQEQPDRSRFGSKVFTESNLLLQVVHTVSLSSRAEVFGPGARIVMANLGTAQSSTNCRLYRCRVFPGLHRLREEAVSRSRPRATALSGRGETTQPDSSETTQTTDVR